MVLIAVSHSLHCYGFCYNQLEAWADFKKYFYLSHSDWRMLKGVPRASSSCQLSRGSYVSRTVGFSKGILGCILLEIFQLLLIFRFENNGKHGIQCTK